MSDILKAIQEQAKQACSFTIGKGTDLEVTLELKPVRADEAMNVPGLKESFINFVVTSQIKARNKAERKGMTPEQLEQAANLEFETIFAEQFDNSAVELAKAGEAMQKMDDAMLVYGIAAPFTLVWDEPQENQLSVETFKQAYVNADLAGDILALVEKIREISNINQQVLSKRARQARATTDPNALHGKNVRSVTPHTEESDVRRLPV